MRDFSKDWNSAIARATFHCAICGRTAAHVALVLENPRSEQAVGEISGLITETGFFGEWQQVVLRGGLRRVADALAGEDAAALYEVQPLWAPFYCPECPACYCNQHWKMKVIYDEEWPTWYDYTMGICPEGHTRMVDD